MGQETKAIVIGGSMTGIMTARVLSDKFDRVIILERDAIPEMATLRGGVPQAKHVHGLLARGEDIMDELFPGFSDELTEAGAPVLRWGYDNLFVTVGGHSEKYDMGIRSHVVSRVLVEHLIRQRLMEISNVEMICETQVTRLIEKHAHIIGIEYMHRKTKTQETLYADLVVDASGRNSKTPEWLQAIGYNAPEETKVDAHIGYATQWFEVPEGYTPDYQVFGVFPDYDAGLNRGGYLAFVEDNKAVMTVSGYNKDYPSTEEDGFMDFLKSLQAPYLYEFAQQAQAISPIYGYRGVQNRIRHYERLSRRPENFIVLGDAYSCFNPIYGQGMTTVAVQVKALQETLNHYDVQGLDGFAKEFQNAISKVVLDAWTMATAEDLRYPETEGDAPSLILRIMQTYSKWMIETATHDRVILMTFAKMMNLQVSSLLALRPDILGRVVWHKFIRRKSRRPADFAINFDSLSRKYTPVMA